MKYVKIFIEGYQGYASYFWQQITDPSWNNYFYWLIAGSIFFFILETLRPWRKNQPKFRKDFWLDAFYMFFNFFLFSLIIYNAASDVVVNILNDIVFSISGGFNLQLSNPMKNFPMWLILIIGFILRDFIQWWVHRLLHFVPSLWNFHKVHHSVEEMGFAAQLRYHWMENIVYRSIEYLPLALMGIGLHDFFIIHIFTFMWGHYNHTNISIDSKFTSGIFGTLIGIVFAFNLFDTNIINNPSIIQQLAIIIGSSFLSIIILSPIMKKLFNSPEMHIWHHAYNLPEERKYGCNFGLTLAIWDYIFKTNYIPSNGRDIKLGFEGLEKFPDDFIHQQLYGVVKKK